MDSFFFFIPYFLEFGDILMEIRKIEPRDFVKVAQLENENWTLASTRHIMDSSAEKIISKIMSGTTYLLAEEHGEILGILDYGFLP